MKSEAPGKPRIKYGLQSKKDAISGYLYVAPFFVIFLVFTLFPVIFNMYVSLFKWPLIGEKTYVGFENFKWLLTDDPIFWKSIGNTFSMWIITIIPQLFLALTIAFILNQTFIKFKNFFRMAVFLPYVTSLVAVGIVFGSIYSRDYGIVNYLLSFIGIEPIDWRESYFITHFAVATMVNWRWVGYNAIIYMAGLQTIPKNLYEAATIDGANKIQQFFYITIPMLRPILLFTIILSSIGGMQLFVEPLIFTNGNGGSANQALTMFMYLYQTAFADYKLGYAAAVGWIMFIIIMLFSLLNWWLTTKLVKN